MLGVHKNHVESLRSLRIGYEVENRNLNVQSITELNSNFVESPLHGIILLILIFNCLIF